LKRAAEKGMIESMLPNDASTAKQDLSSHKAQYKMLRCLLEHIPDRIYFKDTHGAFVLVSHSEAAFLGSKDPAE